ncbi:MAG: hypothetical protein K0R22_38 [Sporomusa sp.]|jgi:hypothetical protein|nr:hypothetical protein [Sporomusa sp.]
MAGKISVEYTEEDLKQLIREDLLRKMPGIKIERHSISIETKSKQNYRSEWESAAFRGKVEIPGTMV